VLALHGVCIAPRLLGLVLDPADDKVAVIRPTFAPVRVVLSPVGDLIPLIRDPIPLIRHQIALVSRVPALRRRLRRPKGRRHPLGTWTSAASQPGTLPLQGPVIGAKLRRAAPDIRCQSQDLGASGCVTS
jgi:hypothetical protein